MDPVMTPELATGMTVFGSDRGKIGKIVEVHQDYIVVEKGFFFPTDHFIPLSAIARVGEDKLYLGVTKDAAMHQGWDRQPTTDAGYDAGYVGDADRDVVLDDPVDERTTGTQYHEVATGSEAIRVPVYEEDLVAVTRQVDRGSILIEKELITEQRTITVPVTEERVRVTRVPAGTPGSIGADAFENGAIEIPLRGEEVDVETISRLAGEVVVEKEGVQRTERLSGTVRREEVHVDERRTGGAQDAGQR